MPSVKARTEQRGSYSVRVYEVEITPKMREKALDFATKLIENDDQYLRLIPKKLRESLDSETIKKIAIQRTYVGKLGEMVFSVLLTVKRIQHDVTDMFTIFPGQTNVDDFDFITPYNETVDIKTGFRPNHTRLMVNMEQFNDIPKDYYVGVKLNAVDIDPDITLVDWDSITQGTVQGYADHNYMEEKVESSNYGEGEAKALFYSRMMGIDSLLSKSWNVID